MRKKLDKDAIDALSQRIERAAAGGEKYALWHHVLADAVIAAARKSGTISVDAVIAELRNHPIRKLPGSGETTDGAADLALKMVLEAVEMGKNAENP